MPIRLDPRLPLVWRTPDSLQLGVDHPVARLDSVSNAEERMLAALVGGTTETELSLIAEAAGAPAETVGWLLTRVAGALSRTGPTSAPRLVDVVVTGTGATADRIRYALDERGLLLRECSPGTRPDLAIIVAHFVIDPADRGRWLSLDVPHVAVLLGDSEARLGPIVDPGVTPCLQCLELHRRDADTAWPAIASQLWGRAAAIDTPLFAGELTAQLMRMIDARLGGIAPAEASVLSIDAASGERTMRAWTLHPECGCATPPGSDSAGDRHSSAAPATTTDSAAPALA